MHKWFLLPALRLSGARKTENIVNGNLHLVLNKKQALGEKNFIIELPKDRVIFEHVKRLGCWEIEVCLFLSQGMRRISTKHQKIATLIDLGANSGLISLQTIRILNTKAVLVLVEPVPIHLEAINFNLSSLRETCSIRIFPIALGKENEKMQIYSDVNNFGNTSLSINAMPDKNFLTQVVDVVDTQDWAVANLDESEFFVIKSDLQGHDAMALSRIPQRIWDRTECAVVEIWASPEINEIDVDKCLAIWSISHSLSWDAGGLLICTPTELRKFWLSQANTQRNLFISKLL
jgi:FkbM family methyltransferase